MELWIRSQNKVSLYVVTELYVCKNYGSYMICNYPIEVPNDLANVPIDYINLGTYKTKERALEVLDEIQSAIEHDGTAYYDKKKDVLYNLFGVYEMPEE